MPAVSLTIPNTEQSVTRPVVISVVKQIFDELRLSHNTAIRYAGRTSTLSNFGTTIDDSQKRNPKFASQRLTYVTATETPVIESIQEHHFHDNEYPPFFNDPSIGLSLRPGYINTSVALTITYRTNSRDEADRCMHEIFIRKSRGRDYPMVAVDYSYSLSSKFFKIIEEAWRLRERVAGYGETLAEYFTRHVDQRPTIGSDRAGKNYVILMNEREKDILFRYDFDVIPDEPQMTEGNIWEIVIGGKFTYMKPATCFLRYPVIVHNQLMPDQYLYSNNDMPIRTPVDDNYGRSGQAMAIFDSRQIAAETRNPTPWLRLPDFDDFRPENIQTGSSTVFTALCLVEDDGVLCDLNDLDGYVIDPDILEFMATEKNELVKRFSSVLNIGLYINEDLMDGSYIEITDDLKVKLKKPSNLRWQHRIRLSLMTDTRFLDKRCLTRLMENPKAFVKIVSSMNELLAKDPDFRKITGFTRVEPYMFSRVWDMLTNTPLHNGMHNADDPRPYRKANFLAHLTPDVIEAYRRIKRNTETVQVGYLVALKENR